jgi:hypothetical protein
MTQINNITGALSFASNFIVQCSSSIEAGQTTLSARYVGLEALDKFALAFLMNMTTSLLLMYQVFQSLTLANANCDFATVAQRMGTLVKQLLAFDKDILGVAPAAPPAPPSPTPAPPVPPASPPSPTPPTVRLMSQQASPLLALSALSSPLMVHKNRDSLFWKVGEPLFNTVRDAFAKSAEMAREDLESREAEANQKGPIQKMEEKLDRLVNQPRRKYKTQT